MQVLIDNNVLYGVLYKVIFYSTELFDNNH